MERGRSFVAEACDGILFQLCDEPTLEARCAVQLPGCPFLEGFRRSGASANVLQAQGAGRCFLVSHSRWSLGVRAYQGWRYQESTSLAGRHSARISSYAHCSLMQGALHEKLPILAACIQKTASEDHAESCTGAGIHSPSPNQNVQLLTTFGLQPFGFTCLLATKCSSYTQVWIQFASTVSRQGGANSKPN